MSVLFYACLVASVLVLLQAGPLQPARPYEKVVHDFGKFFLAMDADSLAKTFHEDAVWQLSDLYALEGRDAIHKYVTQLFTSMQLLPDVKLTGKLTFVEAWQTFPEVMHQLFQYTINVESPAGTVMHTQDEKIWFTVAMKTENHSWAIQKIDKERY